MDGLSAGIAVIAALSYMAVLSDGQARPLVAALAGLVGASLGFLVYNARPASIFMGDSGSLFIGLFLAGTALLAARRSMSDVAPVSAIPLLILLVPIFDTIFVSVTRRMAGRSPMLGGRDHLSHRLVALGIDERRAVHWLYGLAALGGVVAVTLQRTEVGYAAILIALSLILLDAIAIVLGHVEAHAAEAERRRTAARLGTGLSQPVLRDPARRLADRAGLLRRVPIPLPRRSEFGEFLRPFAASFPLVIACQLAGLALAGKYRHVWRSVGNAGADRDPQGLAFGSRRFGAARPRPVPLRALLAAGVRDRRRACCSCCWSGRGWPRPPSISTSATGAGAAGRCSSTAPAPAARCSSGSCSRTPRSGSIRSA